MKLGKWSYELIIIIVLALAGLTWLLMATTADERAAKAELNNLIKYAQRQALEIAVIEQAAKLAGYKQQLAKVQQTTQRPIAPLNQVNLAPTIPDPKDVDVNR